MDLEGLEYDMLREILEMSKKELSLREQQDEEFEQALRKQQEADKKLREQEYKKICEKVDKSIQEEDIKPTLEELRQLRLQAIMKKTM